MTTDATGAKPDHNSLGKAASVIGVIALILSFIPFVGFVSWLLAPLSVIFGLIGLRKQPRSLAIVGIITGIIALFVCVSWVKGAKSVGEAMSADTFNNTGQTTDNSASPIIPATIKGVWKDIEDNKIAAGKKYGNHRLSFTNEKIGEFSGDAANPAISFVASEKDYLVYSVNASFAAADGEKIGALKKGAKVSFICNDVKEAFGDGYSLTNCSLK